MFGKCLILVLHNHMTKAVLKNLKRTITASLNLIILDGSGNPFGTGAGVVINFKGRYFLCTVEHNIEGNQNKVALLTGIRQGEFEMALQPSALSFLDRFQIND